MKKSRSFAVVLVTAPDLKTARRLAQSALGSRLVACANLVPRIESHYWWQGKLETGAEVLLLFKTTKAKLAALEELILSEHPYDTPEFVVLPVEGGTKRYLDWVAESVRRKPWNVKRKT
ncbi:MAG: divalent-cation tolerance protein CutA [Verrucomicrobia bacterium]|nr:divalent-cation tolerance protein CutA [Verrucomicrobiota bacterium]